MDIELKIVEIFYFADNFSKEFNSIISKSQIVEDNEKKHRNKPCKLSDAEVMTIMILFHMGGYRNLKHFYIHHIQKYMTSFELWLLNNLHTNITTTIYN